MSDERKAEERERADEPRAEIEDLEVDEKQATEVKGGAEPVGGKLKPAEPVSRW
ncbi:MAG: hypothetical protein ACRDL0_14875 [Thermoleophilaceae bacterium]